jgi:hypothetical protein
MLIHPLRHFYPWAMVAGFALLTTFIYMTATRLAKAL